MSAVVVGAGIYGVTAALELRRRGRQVTLIDPGPLPHADAASTDISKLVRMDYGADAGFTELMERAFDGWARWNASWERPLYHADGILVLCQELRPGSFEGDSWTTLRARGHALERVDPEVLKRYRAWRGFVDGYVNRTAGWAQSGRVVERLLEQARAEGVAVRELRAISLLGESRVTGVQTDQGTLSADVVVLAVGTWLPRVLPELSDRIRSIGQPVLHFRPSDPRAWRAPWFLPWAADIGNTGWYGFPANADGIVKVANHGPGVEVDPTGTRVVDPSWEERFRAFFREHLPALVDAPLVGTRLCLYADTFDGDFWIGRHPDREGLVVSGGGSGHGFKFAPILGQLTADAVDGGGEARFAWRKAGERRTEDARFDG